jgi:16S rRNA (adenine1518-N6/adenine1519-N6)-dimethyltransferase
VPGTKEYGFLTAIVRYHCDVVLLKTMPPQVFWPRPEVSSTVIKVVPHPVETPAKDYAAFRTLCRAIFNHRRKNLLNSLAHSGLGEKAALSDFIRSAGIEPGMRGENLSVEEMVALADKFV